MQQGRTRWYVLTVVVLGAAFVIDRFVLSSDSGPAGAQAAIPVATEPGLIAPDAPLPDALKLEVMRFPAFSKVLNGRGRHRDPFQLSPTVREALLKVSPENNNQDPTAPSAMAMTNAEFAERHNLSAVMKIDGKWSAVVDGVVIGPGHQVGGCVVTDIDARSVSVLCGSARLVLLLKEPLTE